jgi:hypothetical protein
MSWLKRIEPLILHQGSDIPYVVLDGGVLLCFDNYYFESADTNDYNISLSVHKSKIKRGSTNYFVFKEFPVIVPFDNVIALDDTIIEGRIIRRSSATQETSNIVLIKDCYLSNLDNEQFQEFIQTIDDYDAAFLLVGENIEPEARLLADFVHTIRHQEWPRTCVAMAHHVCQSKFRKYCWTSAVPELSIACYGFDGIDDLDEFKTGLEQIGISSFCATWEG